MTYSTVTNTTFDAALAAIAAPYGPLSRTANTDLDVTPSVAPNSHIEYEVDSDTSGVVFYISYDQLSVAGVAAHIIKEAHGIRARLQDLQDWVTELDAVINGTNFDPMVINVVAWQRILKAFAALPMLGITWPFEGYPEVNRAEQVPLVAAITAVEVALVTTITNNSTGYYHFGMVDWGDGSAPEMMGGPNETPPGPHTYVAGSYTIRTWLIGPQGISSDTDAVTPS